MAAFTSGTQARDGRTVNHDPNPYVCTSRDGWCQEIGHRMGFNGRDTRYAPRAEFAVFDNPILADLRTNLEFGVGGPAEMLRALDETPITDTPEQIGHARRVLSKLAALGAVSS